MNNPNMLVWLIRLGVVLASLLILRSLFHDVIPWLKATKNHAQKNPTHCRYAFYGLVIMTLLFVLYMQKQQADSLKVHKAVITRQAQAFNANSKAVAADIKAVKDKVNKKGE